MYKHVDDRDSKYFNVIDLETGEQLPRVVWADDEAGVYAQRVRTHEGWTEIRTLGRIKLVDTRTETNG